MKIKKALNKHYSNINVLITNAIYIIICLTIFYQLNTVPLFLKMKLIAFIIYYLFLFLKIYTSILLENKLLNVLKENWNLILISIILNGPIALFIILELTCIINIINNTSKTESFDQPKIFPSRKTLLKQLEQYLNNPNINSVLIDGKWGSGKTFFVNCFLEKKTQYIPIHIRTSLYKDKIEVRKFLFQELKILLKKYNIGSHSATEIIRKFNSLQNNKISELFLLKDSLEESKKELTKLVELLPQKIIIILDDLERVQCPKTKLDIISFISDIDEFFKFKVLVLMDLEKENEHSEYLEKYYDSRLELPEVEIKETLSQLKLGDFSLLYMEIFKEINEFKVPRNSNESEEYKKFKEKMKLSLAELREKIKNPRFVTQFFEEFKSSRTFNCYNRQINDEMKNIVLKVYFLYYIMSKLYPEEYQRYCKTPSFLFWIKEDNPINDKYEIIYLILCSIKIGDNINFSKDIFLEKIAKQKEILTQEEESKKYSYLILQNYKNKITSRDPNNILEEYNHIISTKDILLKNEFDVFIEQFKIYIKEVFDNGFIDSREYLHFILKPDIFNSIKILPNLKRKGEFFFNNNEYKGSILNFFSIIDLELIATNYYLTTHILDCTELYSIISPSGVYDVSNFMASKRYLKYFERDSKTIENITDIEVLDIMIKIITENVKDKKVPKEDYQKLLHGFKIVKEMYLISQNKKQEKISAKLENFSNTSDLVRAIQEKKISKEQFENIKNQVQEKFSEEYQIKYLIMWCEKKLK